MRFLTIALSAATLAGCASTYSGHERVPSSAPADGQKFTCHNYAKDLGMVVVVKGTSLWLVDRWGGAREFKVDTSTSIPHGRAEDYRADVIRVSGEDPSVQVDKRMVDGSWKKNVISNSAGWTVFPELSFVVTAERDEYWDCLPGDKGPSY